LVKFGHVVFEIHVQQADIQTDRLIDMTDTLVTILRYNATDPIRGRARQSIVS